jgi:hypothetical protein
MFTLLPPEEKKKLTKEYRQRLGAVYISSLCVTILFAAIFLLPSYMFSKAKADEITIAQKALEKSALLAEEGQMLAGLKNARDELSLAILPEPVPSDVIFKVISHQSPGVRLTAFDYHYDPSLSTLLISGIADTRQDLISFVNLLKNDPAFSSADYPISDLSSSKNINFSINLTGAF